MIRFIIFGIICLSLLFSIQITYAQENIEFESGKNIREWESISAALIDKDRYDEAIIFLDRILEQEPNNLKALSNKSGILIELERYDESVEIADIVLKNEPNRISALTNKAIALKMLKEYEKSYEVFTKIIYFRTRK